MTAAVDDGGTVIGEQIAGIGEWLRALPETPADLVVPEGLSLIARATGADRVVLTTVIEGVATTAAVHPLDLRAVEDTQPCDDRWLPWGIPGVRAQQFVFAGDARSLPVAPSGGVTLGDLGVRSAAYLPVADSGATIGALQLWWTDPIDSWDDSCGAVVRNVARLLLDRLHVPR